MTFAARSPHRFYSPGQASYYFVASLGHIANGGDLANVRENIGEARWLEVHHHGRPGQGGGETRHRAIADRANVAEFLRENDIGTQLAQKRFVDGVNGAVFAQSLPHSGVDFVAR